MLGINEAHMKSGTEKRNTVCMESQIQMAYHMKFSKNISGNQSLLELGRTMTRGFQNLTSNLAGEFAPFKNNLTAILRCDVKE